MRARHVKQKSLYSKTIVAICIVTVIAFTITCLWFYWNDKQIDPVLIASFFACFGLEFGSLAFVKRGEYRYVSGETVGHVERIEETNEDETDI